MKKYRVGTIEGIRVEGEILLNEERDSTIVMKDDFGKKLTLFKRHIIFIEETKEPEEDG